MFARDVIEYAKVSNTLNSIDEQLFKNIDRGAFPANALPAHVVAGILKVQATTKYLQNEYGAEIKRSQVGDLCGKLQSLCQQAEGTMARARNL